MPRSFKGWDSFVLISSSIWRRVICVVDENLARESKDNNNHRTFAVMMLEGLVSVHSKPNVPSNHHHSLDVFRKNFKRTRKLMTLESKYGSFSMQVPRPRDA